MKEFRVFGRSALHAEHLSESVHDAGEVRLMLHDCVDVLVGRGDFIENAAVRRDGQTYPLTAKELQLFRKLYENAGRIVTTGALCEAVMSEPAAEGVEPGYVIEVFRKGYKKGGKVIRYAQVKVTT